MNYLFQRLQEGANWSSKNSSIYINKNAAAKNIKTKPINFVAFIIL